MSHQGQASAGARTLRALLIMATVVVAVQAVSAVRAEEPARLIPTDVSRFAVVLDGRASSVDGPGVAEFRPGQLERTAPHRSGRFYDAHLMPRLNSQFDTMGAYGVLPEGRRELQEWVMFDELTESAKNRAERGTRRALKNYLLEVSTLERTVDAVRGSDDAVGRAGRPVRFRVKISHGTPKLDMRYRLSGALMRFGVGVDGSMSAEFRRARSTSRTWIVAGYDADDGDYNLVCRLSF